MKIQLKNIGIVKDSTISIEGLTVITGKNNSGKTTVGKTLYSILDAVSNLQQKARFDRVFYIRRQIEKVSSTLEVLRYLRPAFGDNLELFNSYPALQKFLSLDYRYDLPRDDAEQFAHRLADDLRTFDVSWFEENKELKEIKQYEHFLRFMSRAATKDGASFESMFNKQRDQALSILEKLFDDLKGDPELIAYARESINQTLRLEFANQIQPVSVAEGVISKIELFDDTSGYFSFSIENNNVVNDGNPVFFSTPFQKVYLIDDPFVLDDMYSHSAVNGFNYKDSGTILDPRRINSHEYKLSRALKEQNAPSVFEQTVLNNALAEINEQFDKVIPGTFEFTSDGDYYVRGGAKLKLSNLATGSKMFSIMKMLLDKGEIDNTTMLILDEPEAHLHPMWQNAFAEIIVLLVKKVGVHILLTTHSPNFMLALDAYMRKYDISDVTNFYQTEMLEDNFVNYKCVNDNMETIYQDFLQYLSEVKMLRNEYLHGIGE